MFYVITDDALTNKFIARRRRDFVRDVITTTRSAVNGKITPELAVRFRYNAFTFASMCIESEVNDAVNRLGVSVVRN